MGVEAYLKAKNIGVDVGHPEAEDDGAIITKANEDTF